MHGTMLIQLSHTSQGTGDLYLSLLPCQGTVREEGLSGLLHESWPEAGALSTPPAPAEADVPGPPVLAQVPGRAPATWSLRS